MSAISQPDTDRLFRLLRQDLVETVGGGYDAEIEAALDRQRKSTNDLNDLEQRVVDDVQQLLRDAFVDTSWPTCPEHANHPLWYSDGWWCCEQSGTRVAPLGNLRRGARP
jgi:hypothetical protein